MGRTQSLQLILTAKYCTLLTAFIFVAVVGYMYMTGGVYMPSRHALCFWETGRDDDGFCDIKVLDIDVPATVRRDCLLAVDDSKLGVTVSIPFWRSGRTITTTELPPSVLDFYEALQDNISSVVGRTVHTTPLSKPTSAAILVYNREGDFINWHYDVNYYNGRFFTLLLPLTYNETCTTFMFMNKERSEEALPLPEGKAILFEGERVFHMASKMCAGQNRAILSMQFSMDPRIINFHNKFFHYFKDRAFTG